MAMVIAYDDAKANQRVLKSNYNKETVMNVSTPLLGSRGNPNLPLASLTVFGPGRLSTPHYHDVDQFQIMIDGKGKMGRHDIAANSVHFSTAFTPYGPFVADAEAGLTCLIIRPYPDKGAQHSPEAVAALSKMPNRLPPWQVTHKVAIPQAEASDVLLQPVPEIQNNNGLATYALNMKPHATILTPDPVDGNGLFVVVLKGSLLHENKESKALTLVYLSNTEGKFDIRAGFAGLEGLIVQFPRSNLQPANIAKETPTAPESKAWHCSLCSFVYNETTGIPEEGIAPGTRWEDVPADWTCPDCAADKGDFQLG